MSMVGCSTKTLEETPPTVAPAQPAESPPLSQAPAGVVRPLNSGPQAAVFDSRIAQLVILTSGPTPAASANLTMLGSQQTSQRVVELPGPVTGLTGGGEGAPYLSPRGGYFGGDLAAPGASRVRVSDAENVDFTAITRRADGTVALGTADGAVYTLAPGAQAAKRAEGSAPADSLDA